MTLALLITAATGAWAEEKMVTINSSTMSSGAVTATGFKTLNDNIYVGQNPATITTSEGVITKLVIKKGTVYVGNFTEANVGVTPGTITYGSDEITVTDINAESVTLSRKGSNNWSPSSVDVYYGADGPEVTITGTSTEGQQAEFDMPQNDVTVTYTLKRDLSVETQVTVGDDHSAQPRYRVQKQGNTFQPYGMTTAEVMALFRVHDQIENEDLNATDDYTVLIYPVDIEGQPTGEAITFQNFTYAPGQYIVKAQGQGNYVGQTTESNIFTLYQGYEVEVAAQSFATYYSDEALTLEESFAETAGLYTISEVTATEAVLSEKIDVMPKRTPMLIYNESETLQTVLLIPTADVAPLTDVAAEFKGTAVEKTVSADEVAATNFYVLTDQNQFVWVKDAGTIAAHKCWLEIAPSQAAGARRIVFSGSGTTGIDAATLRDITTGDWYDLNGRKINMPTKKGVYIFNGKKVVVK